MGGMVCKSPRSLSLSASVQGVKNETWKRYLFNIQGNVHDVCIFWCGLTWTDNATFSEDPSENFFRRMERRKNKSRRGCFCVYWIDYISIVLQILSAIIYFFTTLYVIFTVRFSYLKRAKFVRNGVSWSDR